MASLDGGEQYSNMNVNIIRFLNCKLHFRYNICIDNLFRYGFFSFVSKLILLSPCDTTEMSYSRTVSDTVSVILLSISCFRMPEHQKIHSRNFIIFGRIALRCFENKTKKVNLNSLLLTPQ